MRASTARVYPTNHEPRPKLRRRRRRLSMLRTKDDVLAFRHDYVADRPLLAIDIAPVLEYGVHGKRVGAWLQIFTDGGPLEDVVWLPAAPRAVYDALKALQGQAAAHEM